MSRGKRHTDFGITVDILEQYLEIVEVMILGLNTDGNIVFINRKGEEILGYDREELLGSDFVKKYIPKRYRKEITGVFQEVLTENKDICGFFENPVITKTGEERIIRWNNTVLRDGTGEIVGSLSSGEDITNRKEVEDALRRSEEKYRTLFETMVQGVVYQNADGKIVLANPAAEEILGLTLDQMQGRTSMDPRWKAIHEDGSDFPGDTHPSMAALKKGREIKDVVMGVFNPGREETVWINIHTIPLFRPNDKKAYMVYSTFEDITEKRKTREELVREKTFTNALIDSFPGTFLVFDDQGRFIRWNKMLEDISGYSSNEIVNVAPVDFFSEEQRRMLTDKVQKVLQGERQDAEADFISKTGEKIPFLLIGAHAVIDDKTYVVSIGIDQSERKETQKVLDEYQRMLSTLMSNLPGIAYRCKNDRDWTMLFLSDGCKRITGYDPRDFIANGTVSFRDIIHPDDRVSVWEHVQQAVDEKRPFELEYRIVTKDGEERWVWEQGVGLPGDDNEIILEGYISDISEQKETEKKLRESRDDWENIFQAIGDPVFILDTDYNIIDANLAALSVFDTTLHEMKGQPCYKYCHNSNHPSSECPLKDIVESKKHDIKVMDVETLDKKFLVSFTPVFKDNKIQKIIHIASDITRQMEVEKNLRESEERYRTTLDAMLEGCQIIDREWRYVYVNETAAQHGRRKKEDLLGKTMMEVYPGIGDTELFKLMEECMKTRSSRQLENEFVYLDGSIQWFELSIQPVPEGIFILSIDMTERKQAGEALRESEERFRTFVENINDIIFSLDVAGRITYLSPVYERLLSYRMDEVIGQDFIKYVHPEDLPGLLDSFKRTLEGEVKPYEFRLMNEDGSTIYVRTSSRTQYKDGELVGLTGVISDITERKKMQEKLIQTEKLSSLGGILSGVAHELNNPLAAIIGYAQLLSNKRIPEDIQKHVDVIIHQSKRTAGIVKSLLTFAREHRPLRKMINVNKVIEESYSLREYELRTNDISFRLNLEKDLPNTLADPYQLQQVFINIINNAFDAIREQGGGNLIIRSFQQDMKIVIQFVDDGPGISKEYIGKIFDPFFTTKEVGQGTGLGLSIVYGIIEEHGGDISVESDVGKGTTFTIELPIIKEEGLPVDEKIKRPAKPDKSYSILVAEDEDSMRTFISEALKLEGYNVKTCRNGEEAIDMIKDNEFDAVVTDIKMPGMGGQNLYTYIQKYHKEIGNRILFITGDVLGADTRHFFKITRAKYLSKPFELNEFFTKLSELLDQTREGS